jgi:hypothetical protein
MKITKPRLGISVTIRALAQGDPNREEHVTISRVAIRWHFALAILASLVFVPASQATPVFLTGINISAAGQDGFEPDVAVDASGNVISVWTRSDGSFFRIQYSTRTATGPWATPITISDAGQSASQPDVAVDPSGNALVTWSRGDGTNIRIQATFRPAGGSFSSPVTISDPGFDATKPETDFDNSGKALITWQRFDGSVLRVQATTRTAGAGGTYAPEATLSQGGEDAFNPQADAGPNVDANGVVVWTRSDGTNLRVQSSRRKDVVGYARPKGATPVRISLVPAYNACATPNRLHGPTLAFASCTPPVQSSSTLTVGTPDANGASPNSTASVRFLSVTGNVATEADEANVNLVTAISDVRNNPALTDYTGSVMMSTTIKITDNRNSDEMPEPGTTQSFPFQWSVPCVATVDSTKGSDCNLATSADALLPGAVAESRRTQWELGQVAVMDAGPNGTGVNACPPTCGNGDETVFMKEGIFIP